MNAKLNTEAKVAVPEKGEILQYFGEFSKPDGLKFVCGKDGPHVIGLYRELDSFIEASYSIRQEPGQTALDPGDVITLVITVKNNAPHLCFWPYAYERFIPFGRPILPSVKYHVKLGIKATNYTEFVNGIDANPPEFDLFAGALPKVTEVKMKIIKAGPEGSPENLANITVESFLDQDEFFRFKKDLTAAKDIRTP